MELRSGTGRAAASGAVICAFTIISSPQHANRGTYHQFELAAKNLEIKIRELSLPRLLDKNINHPNFGKDKQSAGSAVPAATSR